MSCRLRVVARGDQNEADAKKQIRHREQGGGLRAPTGAEGCQITGFVNVKKVPGSVRINLYSPRYSVIPETVNASHWVRSLPPSLPSFLHPSLLPPFLHPFVLSHWPLHHTLITRWVGMHRIEKSTFNQLQPLRRYNISNFLTLKTIWAQCWTTTTRDP